MKAQTRSVETMTTRSDQIAQIYAAEHGRLTRQILRRIGCHSTASDLVQDIFLRIWERATSWNGSPSAFLTRCAQNAVVDYARSQKVRRAAFATLEAQAPPSPASPFEIVAARQTIRSVDDTLAALPRRTRHIFLLNRIHGRSFVEIAGVMEISERAVAKHMARAVAACEICLSSEC